MEINNYKKYVNFFFHFKKLTKNIIKNKKNLKKIRNFKIQMSRKYFQKKIYTKYIYVNKKKKKKLIYIYQQKKLNKIFYVNFFF